MGLHTCADNPIFCRAMTLVNNQVWMATVLLRGSPVCASPKVRTGSRSPNLSEDAGAIASHQCACSITESLGNTLAFFRVTIVSIYVEEQEVHRINFWPFVASQACYSRDISNYRHTTEYAIRVYLGGPKRLRVTKWPFRNQSSSDVAKTFCQTQT